MTNPVDTNGNVKVDFVWGNMPLQPNDQRGMAQLDPALDSHEIAAGEWQGFPGFEAGAGFTAGPAGVTFTVGNGFDSGTLYGYGAGSAGGSISFTNPTQALDDAEGASWVTDWSTSVVLGGSVVATFITNANPGIGSLSPNMGSWYAVASALPNFTYSISEITIDVNSSTITVSVA